MTLALRLRKFPFLQRSVVAIAMATLGAGASAALPQFTFVPGGAALNGASFTGDNILISDYSAVTFGPGGTFSEIGYLAVSAIQLGGVTFTPAGLNSDYGMYIAFSGTGTTTVANPATTPTFGTFSTLTYTLYGYNGTASFGFAGNTPTETATGEVALASGSLISGSVSTIPAGGGEFTPSANAKVNFSLLSPAFFGAPHPFYNMALTSFTNTTSEVEAFDGGFRIRQGGGSLNFAVSPVPEPASYAMLFGGLAAIGFVSRRRRQD